MGPRAVSLETQTPTIVFALKLRTMLLKYLGDTTPLIFQGLIRRLVHLPQMYSILTAEPAVGNLFLCHISKRERRSMRELGLWARRQARERRKQNCRADCRSMRLCWMFVDNGFVHRPALSTSLVHITVLDSRERTMMLCMYVQ